jgi:hypothetical protein
MTPSSDAPAPGPNPPPAAAAPEAALLQALQALVADLDAEHEDEAARVREDFQSRLGQWVTALTGLSDGPAYDEAVREGCFTVNECAVALQHNRRDDLVDVFCDLGRPDAQDLERTYRTLLEWNLAREHPGLWFGVHPDTGRLVATLSIPLVVAVREPVLQTLLDAATRRIRALRDARALPVA